MQGPDTRSNIAPVFSSSNQNKFLMNFFRITEKFSTNLLSILPSLATPTRNTPRLLAIPTPFPPALPPPLLNFYFNRRFDDYKTAHQVQSSPAPYPKALRHSLQINLQQISNHITCPYSRLGPVRSHKIKLFKKLV